jgi:hypothetical protein
LKCAVCPLNATSLRRFPRRLSCVVITCDLLHQKQDEIKCLHMAVYPKAETGIMTKATNTRWPRGLLSSRLYSIRLHTRSQRT